MNILSMLRWMALSDFTDTFCTQLIWKTYSEAKQYFVNFRLMKLMKSMKLRDKNYLIDFFLILKYVLLIEWTSNRKVKF